MTKPATPEKDELATIRKAIAGNEAATNMLIAAYHDSIFRFLYARLGSEADAADCSQEVFLKMVRSLSGLQNESRFRSWLFAIARNEMLNWIRKNRSRVVAFSLQEEESVAESLTEAHPDAELTQKERARIVRECVDGLPEAERDVLALRLDEDITFREIAEILNRPLNTVLGQMRNATKRLEPCLRAKGVAP